MNFHLLHPADQICMMMERIYAFGMTTTSGGNLSIKDSDGDIWITPGSIDKGTLTREDIMQVKPDGTVIGPHKPSVELPFHKMGIYGARLLFDLIEDEDKINEKPRHITLQTKPRIRKSCGHKERIGEMF